MEKRLIMRGEDLLALVAIFVPFSLLSIGGGSAILAGIQYETVQVQGWLTPSEFVQAFAVSRAAPGPGMMIATLIGWHVAGWTGAVIATVAMFGPSSMLTYVLVRATNAHREKKWHKAVRQGLAPVGLGLTIAGAITIFRVSGGQLSTAIIGLTSLATLLWIPRIPVLLILAFGAASGLAVYYLSAA